MFDICSILGCQNGQRVSQKYCFYPRCKILALNGSIVLGSRKIYKSFYQKGVLATFTAYFEEPLGYQKLCLQNQRHVFTTLQLVTLHFKLDTKSVSYITPQTITTCGREILVNLAVLVKLSPHHETASLQRCVLGDEAVIMLG